MASFKRVPAIDKCFAVLDLLASEKRPLSLGEIASRLAINKSTAFHMLHTLLDLNVLETAGENAYQPGFRLYLLGRSAGKGSFLINVIHPYLEEINKTTMLSAFLGMMHGLKAIILDKVDDAFHLRLHSEVGMTLHLLAGAGGRALLSLLPDGEVERILAENDLPSFTPNTVTDKDRYRELIKKVREEGVAVDVEEYIQGIRAISVPIQTTVLQSPIAIWAVGLNGQIPVEKIPRLTTYLRGMKDMIEMRLTY